MIESVCEGAECWESCIAVSGLFQTIDFVFVFTFCYDVFVCQCVSVSECILSIYIHVRKQYM